MNPEYATVFDRIARAIAWYRQSGWPTRNSDFVLAKNVIALAVPNDDLFSTLAAAMGHPTRADAVHRAVLYRALIRPTAATR